MAETWRKLAFEDDVLLKSVFNAHSIVMATDDNTPVVLEVAEQEIIGRLTGANIDGIAIGLSDNNLLQVDGTSNVPVNGDYAKFTASGLEGKDKAGVLSDLNVADGADVTGSNTPQAHAASHKNSGGDEVLLHELGEPTGAVDFNGQQLQNMVIHTVADDAAKTALTQGVAMLVWQTDDAALYFCTVAA